MRKRGEGGSGGLVTTAPAAIGGAWLVGRATRAAKAKYDFRGRVALVTGSSRGLGLEIARQLIREGARVVLTARNSDDLAEAREQLGALGGEVFSHPCDLSDRSQVRELFRLIGERFGPVEVLVNNAGTIQVGPLELQTREDFVEAMDANYWSAVHCSLEALPDMRARREGRIVNISSIGGLVPVPHLLPYSASKFALSGFSDGLRVEAMKDGVKVTTVYPTLVRTGSHRNALFKGQNEKEYAWFALSDTNPLLSVSAEWAARAIIEASRYGEASAFLGYATKIARVAYGFFPGVTVAGLTLANRLLPRPGGIGTARALGKESRSPLAPASLTALGESAGDKLNQPA
jgi:NAD(P)-dependent dehydrogenase (short-subunit alcohol dehydrogenase family)